MDMEKVIKELEEISDYFFDIYRNEKNGYSLAQEYCNAAEDALVLLKEQNERIKTLEHQLETITKWRENAGAFD